MSSLKINTRLTVDANTCRLAVFEKVFWIRIRTDPHKEMPPGSGSAWTDADPDPGGKKPRKCTGSLGEYRTGRTKVKILF